MAVSVVSFNSLNALIRLLVLSSSFPTSVFVEYEPSDGAGPVLRTPKTPHGKEHEVLIHRLYPEMEYYFYVYTINSPDIQFAGSFSTDSVPSVIENRVTSASGNFQHGLGVGSIGATSEYEGRLMYAYDTMFRKGEIVWYIDIDHLPSTIGISKFNNRYLAITRDGLDIYDAAGSLVKRYDMCHVPHHDIYFDDDGFLWSLGYDSRNYRGFQRQQVGDTVLKIDIENERTDVLLSIFDYFDVNDRTEDSDDEMKDVFPCDDYCRDKCSDWSHGNSIHSQADNTALLLSFRHLDKIAKFKFNRRSREWDIEWQIGAHSSDYRYASDSDRFYHQHGVLMQDNGNVLLFDNGNLRPASEGGEYSRVLELRLNSTNKTVKKVWEYRIQSGNNNRPCYAPSGGIVERDQDTGRAFIHVPECYQDDSAYTLELGRNNEITALVIHNLQFSDLSRIIRTDHLENEEIVSRSGSNTDGIEFTRLGPPPGRDTKSDSPEAAPPPSPAPPSPPSG